MPNMRRRQMLDLALEARRRLGDAGHQVDSRITCRIRKPRSVASPDGLSRFYSHLSCLFSAPEAIRSHIILKIGFRDHTWTTILR